MFYVYILYSKYSDRYYIGHTNDINRRLVEHNNPVTGKKYSAKHLPWNLVFSIEVSESRSEAIKVERFIKKQKSRDFIQSLITNINNTDYFTHLIDHILNSPVRAIPNTRD
jgi:putative endonuclease